MTRHFGLPDAVLHTDKHVDDMVALKQAVFDSSVAIEAGNQGMIDACHKFLTFRY